MIMKKRVKITIFNFVLISNNINYDKKYDKLFLNLDTKLCQMTQNNVLFSNFMNNLYKSINMPYFWNHSGKRLSLSPFIFDPRHYDLWCVLIYAEYVLQR